MFYIIVCLEKATAGSESEKSATINIVGSDTISTLATNMGYNCHYENTMLGTNQDCLTD